VLAALLALVARGRALKQLQVSSVDVVGAGDALSDFSKVVFEARFHEWNPRVMMRMTKHLKEFAEKGGASFESRDMFLARNGEVRPGEEELIISLGRDRADEVCNVDVFGKKSLRADEFCVCGRGNVLVGFGGAESELLHSNCPRGMYFAAYEVLDKLNFHFLRPFKPYLASLAEFNLPTSNFTKCFKPKWAFRGTHYHTQHPIELVSLLNGWSEKEMNLFENFLEWLIANRQERLEFPILRADEWRDFVRSSTRHGRIRKLTQVSHDFCLGFGIESSVVFEQQHEMPLLTHKKTSHEAQKIEIMESIDWLASLGIDHLGSESGLTEFSHGSCTNLLRWMNQSATYARERYGLHMFIKVHCSAGQTCAEFPELKDFNFLPEKSAPEMGVAPHTVQFYSLHDPTPGVYGNRNFSLMRNWMFEQMKNGQREVIFFPETEYWVDFDSPVPLFLPLYARARYFDLIAIAKEEKRTNTAMLGQLNFDSGFEWGYWINSVVTARAAFDPRPPCEDGSVGQAFRNFLQLHVTRHFSTDASVAFALAHAIGNLTDAMHEKMVLRGGKDGLFGNKTAISYLQGYGTFADIGDLNANALQTSSSRVPFEKVFKDSSAAAFFREEVQPMLEDLERDLSRTKSVISGFWSSQKPGSSELWEEVLDCIEITRLRTKQALLLYDFVITRNQSVMEEAGKILDDATEVVKRRERAYAVPARLVSSWTTNPTSYKYRYLWTVSNLYYWFRDEAIAKRVVKGMLVSPCFRNKENILEELIYFKGIKNLSSLTERVRNAFHRVPFLHQITDCLNSPNRELGPFTHQDIN